MILTDQEQSRLLSKCTPEPNTGCWLWLAGDNGRGYGRLMRDTIWSFETTALAVAANATT